MNGSALLTEAESFELGDLMRLHGLDHSRSTMLDLQVGDRFWYLGEHLGVLWVGPIELYEGRTRMREIAFMPVAGGVYRTEWVTAGLRLIGPVDVATPELAAAAAAAWSTMSGSLRAELVRLRAVGP
ncbi:hypothetical protein ADL15_48290 [Actinoplanes awajinensis subsp. mycoplanecinus]|uniref:Uncharacterized protein n=1 Tax=Actinoplanes awajinensis subsp. mycoplanecinus TaxID=135947 RepID=A0A124G7C9_9ACTN|nr:hypothetical protein ADL15_48290 [Actinoplanes awajinensis subsp. mycoplanecinus]